MYPLLLSVSRPLRSFLVVRRGLCFFATNECHHTHDPLGPLDPPMAQRLKDAAQAAFKHIPKPGAGVPGGGAAGGPPSPPAFIVTGVKALMAAGVLGYAGYNCFFSVDGGE